MIGFDLSLGGANAGPLSSDPFASYFAPGGGQSVALAHGAAGGLNIWTEVSPTHAACLRLDNNDPTQRLSWRETLIAELRNIYPIGALTLTGTWSQLQSSGSGIAGSYTGNRAISTNSASALATVTVGRDRPYDIWVHYTGRTSGGYIRVDIDGDQALVNEIGDPASLGFKAFSTYSAVDLQRRLSVKVASGLTGSHEVAVRLGGTASPGGNAILLEAIAITGTLTDDRVLPPQWAPNTAYEMGDEVHYDGIYYSARANGTSGTAGPTHASGIASDGALDWRADNRPTYPDFVAIDYASEREYAIRFTQSGAATELGGQTHGNEPLVTRTVTLDGAPWDETVNALGLSIGNSIVIDETTTWQTQAGAPVADCTLSRGVVAGAVTHDVAVTATGPQLDVEWLYAAMLPMVRWDGESASTVIDTVAAPEETLVNLTDHAGTNPANITFVGARRIGLTGVAKAAALSYGVEAAITPATGNLIDQFSAFLRPNLDARTESGSLDWIAKAYVQADGASGLTVTSGDVLAFHSRHVMAVR
ncbi:MAG: hypothetical protein AAFU41_04885 [Pseudomonadota bacterium]